MLSITAGASVGEHPLDWDMGFHKHPDYEVTVMVEGSGLFQFGEEIRPIREGSAFWVPPNSAHRLQSSSSLIRLSVIHAFVLPPDLKRMFHSVAGTSRPAFMNLPHPDVREYDQLFGSCVRMVAKARSGAEKEQSLRLWVEMLMLFLTRNRIEGMPPLSLANAADCIRTRLEDDVQIRDLAGWAGMSESAFRSAFKSAYGSSPKEYQQLCRLHKATELLRWTTRSMEQVAHNVGYTSPSTFSTWFTQRTGKSPTQWREENHL